MTVWPSRICRRAARACTDTATTCCRLSPCPALALAAPSPPPRHVTGHSSRAQPRSLPLRPPCPACSALQGPGGPSLTPASFALPPRGLGSSSLPYRRSLSDRRILCSTPGRRPVRGEKRFPPRALARRALRDPASSAQPSPEGKGRRTCPFSATFTPLCAPLTPRMQTPLTSTPTLRSTLSQSCGSVSHFFGWI